MALDLQFGPVLAEFPSLVDGLCLTIELTLSAIGLGASLGLLAAMARTMLPKVGRWPINLYVELIRNTPFLVQLYIVFFGLPSIGIKITAFEASLVALTINLAAYATEIFRAGIESIHRSQIEAGLALALTRRQIFQYVILKPAVARVWPALSSQFILIMLASSVCSFISLEELSGKAYNIQSATFLSLEVYIAATLLYLALTFALKGCLWLLGWILFASRNSFATVARRSSSRIEVAP